MNKHIGTWLKRIVSAFSILVLLTFIQMPAWSQQIGPLISCSINGASPVNRGSQVTYTLSQCGSATSWSVTCGVIQSSNATSATVYFSVLGCSSAVLTAFNGSSTLATKTITVNNPPTLTGGSISNPQITINYNTVPPLISATSAGGGNCLDGYNYTWYSSTDSTNWTQISGSAVQNYQPPALTTTTYYKRLVTCVPYSAYTTNVAAVHVYPQIVPGTISPSSVQLYYNTSPGTFTISAPSGGNGSYTYVWQSSPDNSTWTSINDSTTSYSPGNLTSSIYYRVLVFSNGAQAASSSVHVSVYGQLLAGTISPAPQFINYGTNASQMTLSGTTGSDGSYTFSWQSSPDGNSWTTIGGAITTSYTPPPGMITSSYYRGCVLDHSVTACSSGALVTVYPQLLPGSITPASSSITYNTSPGALNLTGVSGGSGTYSYTWQSSPDNANWTTVYSGSATYTPTGLTSTTYYHVIITSNGASATGSSAIVNVSPQLLPGNIVSSGVTLQAGANPGTIMASAAAGGGCSGSYVYQWQSSTDGTNWTPISNTNSLGYSPGNVSASIYYRRSVVCGTETAYTTPFQITIGTVKTNLNYIRVRDLSRPLITDTVTANGLTDPNDVKQTTQYFDGLGRPLQTVAKQASPLLKDLVTVNVYDPLGREATKYLPYVSPSNDGNFKTNSIGEQNSFNAGQFPGEQFYYAQQNFEPSPLNRVQSSMPQGNNWVGSSRGVGQQWLVNTVSDSVRYWTVAFSPGSIPTTSSCYASGTLYKNATADEQGHQIVEYKDMQGKVVLKKVQLASIPGSAHMGWLNTYYVYDDLNNLRFVIQPKGVELLLAGGTWNLTSITNLTSELCFRYEYDYRKRMIIKKVPGAGETWMVYDSRDRLVMTQDSALRSQQKWIFTKYEGLNRPDSTGLITDPTNYNNLSYHQNLASTSVSYPTVSSYTNELLTQTFYEDYTWVAGTGTGMSSTMATNYTGNSNYFITSYNNSPTYAVSVSQYPVTRGLITGTMSKVIGTSSQYLYNISFYDDHGRVIQTYGYNYTGGIDTATNQYDFSGKPIRNLLSHQKKGNTVQNHAVLTKMDYDQGFRPRHIWKNVDNAASDQLIDSIQYNELGQLNAKYLGNKIDSIVYSYNIRGWINGINKNYVVGSANHFFGMELGYDNTSSAAPNNSYLNPAYNGNIEGTVWKSAGDGINRKYDFSYDNVNRLTGAAFLQYTNGSSWDHTYLDFSVSGLTYDANGNILSMTQNGFKVGGSSSIDALTYNYLLNSNKLQSVTDAANNASTLLGDFHYNPSTKQSTDYSYDGNGNLIQDNNKVIDKINYNYLNLAQLVHVNGKGNIVYTYDAAGSKLKKVTSDSLSRHSTTTLYLGGFVYQQNDTITNPGGNIDTLQFIAHEEGRVRWAYHKYTNGSSAYKYEYDFFEKDHLGNTRMVLTQQKDTAQYLASMEAANRQTETQLFGNITNTAYPRASVAGYPNDHSVTNPNDSVSKVDYNGTSGQKTGPSLLLKVMSGDTIKIGVQSYYNTGSGSTNNSSFTDVLNSLANGIVTSTGGGHGTLADFTANNSTVYSAVQGFLNNNESTPTGYPKAYLNWIFLDDQFNYVSSLSGAVQAASTTYPAGTLNSIAPGAPLTVTKNGYLYVWVSNETQGWDVFFDNLSVQHKQGPILEENHYYPFGLTMAGISDKSLKTNYAENKYKFNKGSELQNKEFADGSGLEIYETPLRSLDPQLGRWWQIDPKPNEAESPYSSMGNNPILNNDPLGDTLAFNPDATEEFIEAFYDAFAYLDSHGVGDVLKELQNSPVTITVVELNKNSQVSGDFTPTGNIIHWSPYQAETEGKITMSPATVLDHEGAHALQSIKHPNQYAHDTDKKTGKDEQYDTKEERRVIKGREQKTARALGEIKQGEFTRRNHKAHNIIVSGPTSTKSIAEQRILEQLKQKQEFDKNLHNSNMCIGCDGPADSHLLDKDNNLNK